MPVAGAAMDAAAGGRSGKVFGFGINDNVARELAATVPPGEAAMIVMAQSCGPGRVVEAMKKHNLGGELLFANRSAADKR